MYIIGSQGTNTTSPMKGVSVNDKIDPNLCTLEYITANIQVPIFCQSPMPFTYVQNVLVDDLSRNSSPLFLKRIPLPLLFLPLHHNLFTTSVHRV